MARQNLNNGSLPNDGTGDTLRVASQKINQNFQEIYTFLSGDPDALSGQLAIENDALVFEGSSTDQHEVRLKAANATADRILTLPDADGDFVLTVATQTLTNKTITSPTISSPTISGLTITDGGANHQYSLVPSDIVANRNINLPLLTDSDEFTFNDHTQTLTNKTLTTPKITGGSINDISGNEILSLNSVGNAVNHIEVLSAANAAHPAVKAVGDNTNINLDLFGKGTGGVRIQDKLILATQNATSNPSNISLLSPITFLNISSGSPTCSILDGTEDGEVKHIINRNTATWTLDIPGNPSGHDEVSIPERASISLVYSSITTEWYIISNNGATVS
jgi:hypothetical protein